MRLIATRITYVPPRMVVLIATTLRSGGTVLCASISQTGVLGHPAEFFHLEEMTRKEGLPALSSADCCALACRRGATLNGIVSGKIAWHEFNDLTRTANLDRWSHANLGSSYAGEIGSVRRYRW